MAFIDSPKTRQFTSFNVTCDTSNGTYRASITFNDDETGGSDIQYYNGTVTGPSGFFSQFNVTTNTVVITGLQCSTIYNINVTAVNCAGVSTVTATSFTTPQPSECIMFTCIAILFCSLYRNFTLYAYLLQGYVFGHVGLCICYIWPRQLAMFEVLLLENLPGM